MKLKYLLLFTISILGREFHKKPSTLKNHQVMKVTARSHDPNIVRKELDHISKKWFPHAHYTPTRRCIENSYITYQVNSIQYDYGDYIGSECRLNNDDQFLAILSPKNQIHYQIQQDNAPSPIMKEIEDAIICIVEKSPDYDIKFHDFDNLNYDLECPIDYYEIAQVKLKTLLLKVVLEKNTKIATSCGINAEHSEVEDECLKSMETLNIPINGTFHCANGKSPTCNRSNAVTDNPKLRNYEEF